MSRYVEAGVVRPGNIWPCGHESLSMRSLASLASQYPMNWGPDNAGDNV